MFLRSLIVQLKLIYDIMKFNAQLNFKVVDHIWLVSKNVISCIYFLALFHHIILFYVIIIVFFVGIRYFIHKLQSIEIVSFLCKHPTIIWHGVSRHFSSPKAHKDCTISCLKAKDMFPIHGFLKGRSRSFICLAT